MDPEPEAGAPFDLDACLALLERTPRVLDVWLRDLPDVWTDRNEGPETWSPYDVLGHLLNAERTNWIARLDAILGEDADRRFPPFDRFAQMREPRTMPLAGLLDAFRRARADSLANVRARRLTTADLDRRGRHPEFGEVTARQLLSAWTAHDLDHLTQVARVMAVQVRSSTGPWRAYLRILQAR